MSPTLVAADNRTPLSVSPGDPVVVFDGLCKFCDRSVRFLLRHERAPRLRFAAAQSPAGAALLASSGLNALARGSVVLIEGGRAHQKSGAALRLVPYLRWPWQCLRLGWLVPGPLRDWLYDAFAARRYAWFGKHDSCVLPALAAARRFLR